jgi:lipopolysaccharide export system ATP-binding protein
MTLLNVNGLVKSYGRRRVVDGVAMDVAPGEIVGLLGPNGAGKSTCFKMICGLVAPDKGSVFLEGIDVTNWPLYRRGREGMGYLPQHSSLFNKLTVQANLIGMMQLLSFSRKQQKHRCQELLEQFNITHVRKSLAGTLSGGERRRLEIARCLVAEPKIIMLDEPFAAIDPVTVQSIQSVIRDLAERGIAILITDHAAREILQLTDRTFVVSEGRILCSGTADEIVQHEQVRREYLGDLDIATTSSSSRNLQPQASSSFTSPPNSLTNSPPKQPPETILRFPRAVPPNAADAAQQQSIARPKIVFSKPHGRSAPFRVSDLD